MYTAAGTGTTLAATGFVIAQSFLAGWVLLIAGLAILTILPKFKSRRRH